MQITFIEQAVTADTLIFTNTAARPVFCSTDIRRGKQQLHFQCQCSAQRGSSKTTSPTSFQ